MHYDNLLEFFYCNDLTTIKDTKKSLEKIKAKNTASLIQKSLELITKHNETLSSIKDKPDLMLCEILSNPENVSNPELVKDFDDLENTYYSSNENISELNLAYFEKYKEELWAELN